MRKTISKITAGLIVSSMLVGTSSVAYARDADIPQAKLHWNQTHQVIDGFGASQSCDVYADQIYEFDKRDEVMDLLFSGEKGIGLSILRSEVGNGLNMPTIHPDPETWDFTAYEPEQWVLHEAKKRGVEKIMSTVWSPPAWMKTTNRIVRGGHLKKECYQDYAEYLVNYVKGYKEHHGVEINAVSIANEPEYAAPWQPVFEKEHLDTDIIVGEEGTWTDKRLSAVYEKPEALEAMDIVGGHYYHGQPHEFTKAKEHNKRVWETEVSDTLHSTTDFKDGVKWSRYVHDFMTKSDANAFLYWLGASYKTNNESLIRLQENGSYIAAKRLYSLGNFSKYVRPGYVRMDIDENPYGNLHLSAYKNPETGEFAIVAVNDGQNNETFDLNFDGITCGELTPHITNERYNLETFKPIGAENGKFRLSVSGYTTITYTGTANSREPEKRVWRLEDELADWSKIYSRSDDWMIERNNPYNAFDHDLTRARRTSKSLQNIVYRLDSMTDFEAVIYYHMALEGLSFETSTDGEHWTALDYRYDPPTLTGGFWERIVVKPEKKLEEGTQFLRINFDGGGKAWDKHLTKIHIN